MVRVVVGDLERALELPPPRAVKEERVLSLIQLMALAAEVEAVVVT